MGFGHEKHRPTKIVKFSLDTLKKFEKTRVGNINTNLFKILSLFIGLHATWGDGYLQKTDSLDNDMHQVTLFMMKLWLRKKMIAGPSTCRFRGPAENGDIFSRMVVST